MKLNVNTAVLNSVMMVAFGLIIKLYQIKPYKILKRIFFAVYSLFYLCIHPYSKHFTLLCNFMKNVDCIYLHG